MNCMMNRAFPAAIIVGLIVSGLLFLSAAAAEQENSLQQADTSAVEQDLTVPQEYPAVRQEGTDAAEPGQTEHAAEAMKPPALQSGGQNAASPAAASEAGGAGSAVPPPQAAVPASQNAPAVPPAQKTPETQPAKSPGAISIWQLPAAPPGTAEQQRAPAASAQGGSAVPPLQAAVPASQNAPAVPSPVQKTSSSSGEMNIWQQLAAGPPAAAPSSAAPQAAQPPAPAAPSVAAKDDIVLAVEEAVRQYRANDFAGAISNLDYAGQLIRQKKSERMKSLLPNPMFGWMAKDASAKFLGTAVFGGGSAVSRDYYASGGAIISVEIVSDSPVLQSIVMMLNNPLFAGASGGNIQTIKRQRAISKYNSSDRSGEINIVVDSRFIVTVKGRSVDQAVLLSYAEAMDFDALAKN